MASALLSENRGAYSLVRTYYSQTSPEGQGDAKVLVARSGGEGKDKEEKRRFLSSPLQTLRVTWRQVFLPYGYPDSVSKDYVQYQIWDTVQAFASSITGALATEAVMKGVGVGNETATPLAAALTWLMKSGSGHVGQIVFAWAKGTSLDHDCKKWRLFADGLNDLATFIDLIAPLFPASVVVFVLCLSSVARALVGVAGSATRAAVTQHQARMNNMGDVSAKDGSQETLVNLLALITSLILLPIVSGKTMVVWLLYFFFTGIHLFANYKAVTALEIETLNRPRVLICLQDFLTKGKVGSVKDVNARESVILGGGLKESDLIGSGVSVKMGASVDESLAHIPSSSEKLRILQDLLEHSGGKPFLVISVPGKAINVVLHENILPQEVLEAYCRAIFVGVSRQSSPLNVKITQQWEQFQQLAKHQGFVFSRTVLDSGEWRAKWIHI